MCAGGKGVLFGGKEQPGSASTDFRFFSPIQVSLKRPDRAQFPVRVVPHHPP